MLSPDAVYSGDHRCPRCFLMPRWCICDRIPRLDNRTPVCLVRHCKERYRTSNSARLVIEALQRSRMLTYGSARDAEPLELDPPPGSYLLFPEALDHAGLPLAGGPSVHDLSLGPPPEVAELFVIDGTWAQARRMSHRIEALRELPRLSLPGRPGVKRARESPTEDTTATLEAIALALEVLDGSAVGAPLLALYDLFVAEFRAQCGKAKVWT